MQAGYASREPLPQAATSHTDSPKTNAPGRRGHSPNIHPKAANRVKIYLPAAGKRLCGGATFERLPVDIYRKVQRPNQKRRQHGVFFLCCWSNTWRAKPTNPHLEGSPLVASMRACPKSKKTFLPALTNNNLSGRLPT